MGGKLEVIGVSSEMVGPCERDIEESKDTFVCMVVEDMTSSMERLEPVLRRRWVLILSLLRFGVGTEGLLEFIVGT